MVTAELTLPIVVGGALLDSINPCVIGVLILLLTVLSRVKNPRRMLFTGLIYIAGVYFTYLLGGLTLLRIFTAVREFVTFANMLYVGIGAFVLFAGTLEVKDFFWYGRIFSLGIPVRFVSWIENTVKKTRASMLAAFGFGIAVTLIELPCTGAPYLAVLALMAFIPFPIALSYLLLYNLIFVAPLFAIIYLVYEGTTLKKLQKWRVEHRGLMRLAVGLFLLGLGVWIVSIIYPQLLLPLILLVALIIGIMALLWKIGI